MNQMKVERQPEEETKKTKKMRMTEKDLEMMRWINARGSANASQISQAFNGHLKVIYRRLRFLTQEGFLKYYALFRDLPGAWALTEQGVDLCDSELPPAAISFGRLRHDKFLVDLEIDLFAQFDVIEWKTERVLRKNAGHQGVGQRGHIPDGVMILDDGRRIAVELELSTKGEERLRKIMQQYEADSFHDEIWYFVDTVSGMEVANKLLRLSAKIDKIHVLDRWLMNKLSKPGLECESNEKRKRALLAQGLFTSTAEIGMR